MFSLAFKMLAGDPVKVLGIILGMTLSTALIAQQGGLFYGLMLRSQSVIAAADEVDIWIMHPATEQFNSPKPISDADVARVRGVDGVTWTAPMIKSNVSVAHRLDHSRSALLIGIDDHRFTAAPRPILRGQLSDLKRPNAIAIDRAGYRKLWPGEPIETGKVLTINNRRAIVVAATDAPAAFGAEAIIHTRYSHALEYTNTQRHHISYVLVGAQANRTLATVADRIEKVTGLKALTSEGFSEATIEYYKSNTGIVASFSTTIALGILVGAAIVGLTFSLFVLDNTANYATLKMLGVTNQGLALIVLGQVVFLSIVGSAFGIGLATAFFEMVSSPTSALRGFYLPWWIPLLTVATMMFAVAISSSLAVWRVMSIEPDRVFRGQIG